MWGVLMKINDVIRITGLTGKAIRLYESKGLVNISRGENGYRNYSQDDVETLKSIKLFRSVGISVSDIKLYLHGVMSINELMDKRKAEILRESGKNSEKYQICESIVNKTPLDTIESNEEFTETEKIKLKSHGTVSVGIDIGTTTISASVYDIDNKEQLETYTLPHHSYVCADICSEQSVSLIIEKSEKLLYHILKSYKKIVSIGISGQMHGIVYIDNNGMAVSNLINWQDKRADRVLENGKTACQAIYDITGEGISTGYGIATHYYNMLNGKVPEGAVSFCSIMDYFGMKICGNKKAVIHVSVGASLGLFNVKKGDFMWDKLSLLGIDKSFLPTVTGESLVIGKCKGIPVCIPLGDNQASFLGSVRENKDSMLVNIGTGSQVSAVSDYLELRGEIELRPFIEGKYLICGSALCGGFAYSMLEEFFRSYAVSAEMQETSQYKVINQLAKDAYERGEGGLLVDAFFCGKRSDPNLRGSIKMIDRQNFTPSALVLGVLKGMCNELYELYKEFPVKKSHVVASGGAVKKNEVLKNLIADCFGVSVSSNTLKEEAATGVALFAAFTSKKIKYNNGFNEYIM
ncbi:MAG: MerR family transcriptional regulator [Ruminococcaceae bacterium]|nr:MerR family transcriptional regulator [Oscillospiraceae bacterium]